MFRRAVCSLLPSTQNRPSQARSPGLKPQVWDVYKALSSRVKARAFKPSQAHTTVNHTIFAEQHETPQNPRDVLLAVAPLRGIEYAIL